MVQELIEYCQRRDTVGFLIKQTQLERPKIYNGYEAKIHKRVKEYKLRRTGDRGLVSIEVEGNWNNMLPSQQTYFLTSFSKVLEDFLEMPEGTIKILEARTGSIKLKVLMPSEAIENWQNSTSKLIDSLGILSFSIFLGIFDLSKAKLRGINLHGIKLSNVNLRDADLGDADLRGAVLSGANLEGAHLLGANLRDADLRGTNLKGVQGMRSSSGRTNLRDADLRGADLSPDERFFRRTELIGANLTGTDLRGADLRSAVLGDSILSGANLNGANLSGADLSGVFTVSGRVPSVILMGADLSGTELTNADLSRANLSRANLSRANLSGTNLSGAVLVYADLSGVFTVNDRVPSVILVGADLRGVDLSGADLRSADLTNANLTNADLSNANLDHALLDNTQLKGIRYNEHTIWPDNFDYILLRNQLY